MKNNLTKNDMAVSISNEFGFSISYSKKIVEDFIDTLIEKIKENNLNIQNLGVFKIRKKKERVGRNPKTNESFIIKERFSLSFSASKNLLLSLNKKK